ncbi:MAG: tRNA (guanosine(37)-N1)-methyltransferase TrmD [Myxococcota bacterium]
MRFDLLTLFPGIFGSPFAHSLLSKAIARGLIDIRVHDIREEGEGRHRVADDAPYGGGDGMVMMAGPVLRTLARIRGRRGRVILLSPAGKLLDQATARRLASERHLVLICGRYGGIDERVAELAVDEEISIGDYVLGGGEPAAIALVDAVARLVPGVVGNAESTAADSFEDGLLEYPQFTRPASVRGLAVPEVLLGGDHAKIARWRRKESMRRTLRRRPDLLARARLSKRDQLLLDEVRREEGLEKKGTRRTTRVAKRKERGRP